MLAVGLLVGDRICGAHNFRRRVSSTRSFDRRGGYLFHHGPRFRRPPCDPGRWDFPSPVLTLASRRSPSQRARSLSADSHTPLRALVCFRGRSIVHRPSRVRVLLELPSAQSPFARRGVTSHVVMSAPRQRALPRLHRSYGLMRQSSTLLAASVVPSDTGSVQVAVSPCWEKDLPDVISAHLSQRAWTPTPVALEVLYPFLPSRHRPSPRSDRVGAPQSPCSDFSTAPFSRLQSFADVQAPRCAHHPGRSYRYGLHRMAAVVFTSEPLVGRYLPTPRICLPSESGN